MYILKEMVQYHGRTRASSSVTSVQKENVEEGGLTGAAVVVGGLLRVDVDVNHCREEVRSVLVDNITTTSIELTLALALLGFTLHTWQRLGNPSE